MSHSCERESQKVASHEDQLQQMHLAHSSMSMVETSDVVAMALGAVVGSGGSGGSGADGGAGSDVAAVSVAAVSSGSLASAATMVVPSAASATGVSVSAAASLVSANNKVVRRSLACCTNRVNSPPVIALPSKPDVRIPITWSSVRRYFIVGAAAMNLIRRIQSRTLTGRKRLAVCSSWLAGGGIKVHQCCAVSMHSIG